MRSILTVLLLVAAAQTAGLRPDPAKVCESCDAWNATREPFRVFGNTYYVGVAGLSAVLVTSVDGHILLDAALPQSAALIDRQIRSLGFHTEDVELIVTSHAHYDHVGGVAALQRATGADVAASASTARALRAGEPTPDDPQYGLGVPERLFPPVARVRVVRDREVLRVGRLEITPYFTPGHTPGSTTWTWQSCEGARCLNVVYADSLNPVSADGFRFTAGPSPTPADTLQRSIGVVESLPCDVVIAVHPDFTQLNRKFEQRRAQPDVNPFIDPAGCRRYAADARARLDRRLADERGRALSAAPSRPR